MSPRTLGEPLLLALVSFLPLTASPTAAAVEGAAGSAVLLWHQGWDGWSVFGPSVRNDTWDQEIADDFVLDATITRLVATGTRDFNPPPFPEVTGVEVRFYDVAANGGPGDLLAEYALAAGDPNLLYDLEFPNTFDITLAPPFAASGQHFVGVQALIEGGWYRLSAGDHAPRGSAIWFRDHLAGGEWEPFEDVLGVHDDDIAFELYGTLTAPPEVTSLSDSTLPRSGRLRVFGINLGGTENGGQVLIDGAPALVVEWTDAAIHAYVPETAGPGPVDVQVVTQVGSSAPVPLAVTLRQQVGRARWRFTCDSLAVRHRPAVGPDGTVYAQDTHGILYAVSSAGALEWLVDLGDEGSEGPVVVMADGTIVVGVNPLGPTTQIVAVHPDGTVRWTFTDFQPNQGLIAGPGIGPDGNVYAVTDLGGLGAFSLDPDGELRWSHPGDPPIVEQGQIGQEIGFGADRFYTGYDEQGVNPIALLYGFNFDGDQLFAVGRPNDPHETEVGPDGNVYFENWDSAQGIHLAAYDSDGDEVWTAFEQEVTNVLTHPAVGADGSIYVTRNLTELSSLAPDGSLNWSTTSQGSLASPTVSPDGRTILLGAFEFGGDGSFRAFDATAGGAPLWQETLPLDGGLSLSPSSRAVFAADGRTAFIAAEPLFNPDNDQHCYLYALDTVRHETLFADGFESGTTGAWSATTN